MRSLLVILALVTASVALHAQEGKQKHRNPKVEGELKKLTALWDAAITRADIATLEWLLAPEFTTNGSSRSEYISWVQGRELAIDSIVSDRFDVKVYGSTAVVTFRQVLYARNKKGAAVVQRSRTIDVWVKRQGEWRCVAAEACGEGG